MDSSVLNVVANGGAMAILAYLAVYLVPKWMTLTTATFSELAKTFREEQKYEREMCTAQFKEIMGVLRANQEAAFLTLAAIRTQIEQHQQFSEKAVDSLSTRETAQQS